MTPHKHCKVIKAWADGQEIQTRHDASVPWTDVVSDSPSFSPTFEYRIKPSTVKREGWVNIYHQPATELPAVLCCLHPTENVAKQMASVEVIATVKVEWEETE